MPSTNTITSFVTFSPNTPILSADHNTNFGNFRGHLIPIETATATSSNMTHDLGGAGHLWRGNYNQYSVMYQNTAGSVPATPAAAHMALYFKDDGYLYSKNPAGTESQVGNMPLTTKGDLFGFTTGAARIPLGSDGQVLTVDTTTALGVKWATPYSNPLTTKGDLLGFTTGVSRLPVGTDGQVLTADSASAMGIKWSTISSGGGAFNYITASNSTGDSVSDFTAYADAPGSVPVDMTGGSPNADLTFAVSAVSPLTGTNSILFTHTANDRQGMGWSATYTTNVSDRGKVISFSMDYAIASGSYTSGDLLFYCYDATSGVLIQPMPYSILNHTLTSDKFFAEFQVPYTCASLRIGFHVATSTATAYTMKMDNLMLSDSSYGKWYGSIATDWVAYTPTLTGFGTVSSLAFYSRRVGDNLEINGSFLTGTTTATSATFTIGVCGINGGITIDTAKIAENTLCGTASVGVVTSNYTYTLLATNGSTIKFGVGNSSTNPVVAQNGSTIAGSSQSVQLFASVPISGWSSSQLMSDQADTRVIAAKYFLAGGVTSSPTAPINFATKSIDTHNAVTTGSNWKFTAPVAGIYRVSSGIEITAGAAYYNIFKNGVADAVLASTAAGILYGGTALISLIAGDYIDLRIDAAKTTASYATQCISIERISGPAQIRASEMPISIIRRSTGAGHGGTNTKIRRIETTVGTDQGSDITYSSSAAAGTTFTINTTGIYAMTYVERHDSTVCHYGISLNSTQLTTNLGSITAADRLVYNENPSALPSSLSITLRLVAGDVIRPHTDGTPNTTSANACSFTIARVR